MGHDGQPQDGQPQHVGAFPMQQRAYGAIPIWERHRHNVRLAQVTFPAAQSAARRDGSSRFTSLQQGTVSTQPRHSIPLELQGSTMTTEMDQESMLPLSSACLDRSEVIAPSTDVLQEECLPQPKKKDYPSGMWQGMVILLFLVGAIIGLGVGLSKLGGTDSSGTPLDANSSTESTPTRRGACNVTDSLEIPNVIIQCACLGSITHWTSDMEERYNNLRDTLVLPILPDFDQQRQDKTSCDPRNAALAQLAMDESEGATATVNRYLLTLYYAAWGGKDWVNDMDWLSLTVPECEWTGITCQGDQIVSIQLTRFGLKGSIPTELALLTSLEILLLDNNELTGSLPTELSQMQSLQRIVLSVNYLTGAIPTEVGLLTNLETLAVELNFLQGTIPTEISKLPSIEVLGLWDNQLEGTIPTEIGTIRKLNDLQFQTNYLTGTLPSELGLLGNLTSLHGGQNNFRGTLPTEIGNLRSLLALSFDSAGWLGGVIPTQLGFMKSLESISLTNNKFFGTLPTELGNLTSLVFAHLSTNRFSGAIPVEIGLCSKLFVLDLSDNSIGGTLPSQLGSLSSLATLQLEGIRFVGSAPQEICSLRDGALKTFIATCSLVTFQCSVPACCTECNL